MFPVEKIVTKYILGPVSYTHLDVYKRQVVRQFSNEDGEDGKERKTLDQDIVYVLGTNELPTTILKESWKVGKIGRSNMYEIQRRLLSQEMKECTVVRLQYITNGRR